MNTLKTPVNALVPNLVELSLLRVSPSFLLLHSLEYFWASCRVNPVFYLLISVFIVAITLLE